MEKDNHLLESSDRHDESFTVDKIFNVIMLNNNIPMRVLIYITFTWVGTPSVVFFIELVTCVVNVIGTEQSLNEPSH